MKILQINTVVNTGSTGRIAEEIGITLQENGHSSYIAHGRGNQTSNANLLKIGTQKDQYQHGFQSLIYDRHGLGSVRATKKFLKKIECIKPDVIGLHNLHGYYINYQILFNYIRERDIPVLWTFHDCWPFTGHCTYFERVNCEKWKTHCQKCPMTGFYPRAVTDRSFRNFEDKRKAFSGLNQMKIVTPSKWLAQMVKQSFLKDYSVDTIYNGINTEKFKPLNRNLTMGSKIVLGVASTWDLRKGLQDFILLRTHLSKDYEIVLIGLDQKQINKLPEGIKGIRRTESIDELVDWYNKAAVFVNPTYVDNFPTTNIEALACGTPVITYDTGGSVEAVTKITGTIITKGDIPGLASAVRKFCQIDKTKLISKCRDHAVQNFKNSDRFLDYLKLYEQFKKR